MKPSRELRLSWRRESCLRMGLIPLDWSDEARGFAPTTKPRFYKVQCPHCVTRWVITSGERIRRHMVQKHGMPFAEALSLWYGTPGGQR